MIELPVLEPSTTREARTVARCHEKFVQRRHRFDVERALVAAASIAYLIAMASDLVGLYR